MRTSDQTQSNPFHEGERAAQLLAGVVRQGAPIRPYMPAPYWTRRPGRSPRC